MIRQIVNLTNFIKLYQFIYLFYIIIFFINIIIRKFLIIETKHVALASTIFIQLHAKLIALTCSCVGSSTEKIDRTQLIVSIQLACLRWRRCISSTSNPARTSHAGFVVLHSDGHSHASCRVPLVAKYLKTCLACVSCFPVRSQHV